MEERAEATEFADLITGDHIVTLDQMDVSIDGKRDAIVLYDVGTRYLDCYPTKSKSTDEAIQALNQFIGPRQAVGSIHTDAARELLAAARALGLCQSRVTPGRPQGNGLAESEVRKVLEGTRTVLEHAGMDT